MDAERGTGSVALAVTAALHRTNAVHYWLKAGQAELFGSRHTTAELFSSRHNHAELFGSRHNTTAELYGSRHTPTELFGSKQPRSSSMAQSTCSWLTAMTTKPFDSW